MNKSEIFAGQVKNLNDVIDANMAAAKQGEPTAADIVLKALGLLNALLLS